MKSSIWLIIGLILFSSILNAQITGWIGEYHYIEKPESAATIINLSQFSRGLYIVNVVAKTGEIRTFLEILN